MRWALVKVCLAVTVMVVIAFAVPLGLVVKETARDRAFSNAERQAATVGPVLAITTDRQQLEKAVVSTEAGGEGRLAVHVPQAPESSSSRKAGSSARAGSQGAVEVGRQRATKEQLETARRQGRASTVRVEGGYTLLRPTAVASGEFAVVEVFIPNDEVTHNVTTSWLILAGVGIALILGSVAVADRLGTLMVRPAGRLAAAAHSLGEGKLGVRVPEDGPSELRSAAAAFNAMADQVVQLLANERELAADLSHRLRTPLTVLRLNAASLGDGDAAEHTREAVAKLESEVDHIISTAREQREQRAQTTGTMEASACDAAEVIRERMSFWSALAEDEGREARLAGVDRPVRVPVARGELAAALDAMLGNVFRHTPEGTAFSVDVHHGGTASNSVIVLVSDAGPGIADPDAALRRGHGDGRPGSTGLGLDIVRRVAESTGGDVRIGPSVLGGTEIRVWLTLDGGEAERRRRGRRRSDRVRRSRLPLRRA
ncbi:HAMP domain-containing histidine kinase [Streptomyces bathyalis]|uniref:Signal transduction histidine-protein kinase/phosphatase MprB n=1 Tax=Streptomyces bathyalis TaxID=2710756 RepID=A0A7T1T980_9ACTN|nr:HAMP domain-containing sensor histidine kinase [Streptomyces bathyalis]QPP08702.1 HAMP domain-containing histidine kinase [Streptomyces bathyalis]